MGCKHEQQFLRVIEDTMWCRKCGAVSGIAGRLVMFEPTDAERAAIATSARAGEGARTRLRRILTRRNVGREGEEIMPELHRLGRIAYEMFRLAMGRAATLMPWDHLSPTEQDAWQAAAVAARDDGAQATSSGGSTSGPSGSEAK